MAVVANAQDEKLVAEAKKEGRVAVYGSLETNTSMTLEAFEKKTGVTIEYWRASAATVLDRVISERKTGRPLYDVVINNAGPMEIMLREGIFIKYDSPMTKNFLAESVYPQLGPSYRTSVVGIVYNRTFFSPETGPKSLEDLSYGAAIKCSATGTPWL